MINGLVTAAVGYASRGWRVIPLHHVREHGDPAVCACWKRENCKAAGKHPTIKNWRENATVDIELIRRWWRAWPLSNVGVLMGGLARLVTIDIDGGDGRESLAQLEEANGALPATLTQTTGRAGGGEHRLFTVSDTLEIDRIRNRAHLAPGIDIRAEGGLIVAAPSVHPTGTAYRWCDPAAPVVEMPPWMFKLATSARARQKAVSASAERPAEEELERDGYPLVRRLHIAREALIREAEPAIQGQNGSVACLRATVLLIRGYCLPPNDAFNFLWHHYNPICVPAWSEIELMHKIESAEYQVSVETYPWRYKIPAPDPSPGGRMVEALFTEARSELDVAAQLMNATPENTPDPTKGYANKKRRGAEDDDEEGKIKCG